MRTIYDMPYERYNELKMAVMQTYYLDGEIAEYFYRKFNRKRLKWYQMRFKKYCGVRLNGEEWREWLVLLRRDRW